MYRRTCSCSTRALEAFVTEFAGVSIVKQSTRRLHAAAQTDKTVDAVSLQTLVSEAPRPKLRMIGLAPTLEPASTAKEPTLIPNGAPSSARTKAENRMLRKLKRIQGGSHNKSGQNEQLVGQVHEMLQKIEESPQLLGALVDGNAKKEVKAATRRPGRRQRLESGKANAKWTRHGKQNVEKNRGNRTKASREDVKGQITNEMAGEQTVEDGDDATWEHIQDEWTEEPEFVFDDTAASTKTNKKERHPGKQSRVKDTSPKDSPPAKPQEPWGIQKAALERKFGEKGWNPRKRLSPDTLSGIRALHASNPTVYNVEMLREHFKITPEAIRRILKSKWRPSSEEIEDRMQRWEKRGVRKWSEMAEQGQKPPKKWRALGVPNPKLGQKKLWGSNGGTVKNAKREETKEQEEGLYGKSRRMDNAQRRPFKESLAGRIL